MLQGNPEFLVVRGSTRLDVVVFALLLAFVPPLVVVALEWVVSKASRLLANVLHLVAVWAFGFLALLQLVDLFDPKPGWALLLPVVPAMILALAYPRVRAIRSFLAVSVVLPLIGLVGFAFTTPLAVDDHPGADVDVKRAVPVVLLVLDELPVSSLLRADGSLDAYRYPNLARFASTATWYPRATTLHTSTTQAVPTILTGLRPHAGELPALSDHPDNLFTLLGETYAIRAGEQVTHLCPSRYCPRPAPAPVLDRERGLLYDVSVGYLHRVLPTSLRGGLPPIGERWGGFGDPEVDARDLVLGALDNNAVNAVEKRARGQRMEQFERFLASIGPDDGRPSLTFEHVILPHTPWAFLPSGKEYGSSGPIDGIDDSWIRWLSDPFPVLVSLQRHLLQAEFADRLVGKLLARVRSAGLFDRALVIVAADHGVSFYPDGRYRAPTKENLADIAAIPLFVKYPGQHRSRVDLRDAQTIDIVPTIADTLGVDIPWQVDGRSLQSKPLERTITVLGFDQKPVHGEADAVHAGVMATARRNAAAFGEGKDSMYELGPHKELLGRSVASFGPVRVGGSSVDLDNPWQFDHVRTRSPFVPARIVGSIGHRSLAVGSPLAVAVNGRVAATTKAFAFHGSTRFAVLVPESVFHDGKNAVDVYAVREREDGARLTLLGGTSRASERAVVVTSVASTG
jgi:hypothetical protein